MLTHFYNSQTCADNIHRELGDAVAEQCPGLITPDATGLTWRLVWAALPEKPIYTEARPPPLDASVQ